MISHAASWSAERRLSSPAAPARLYWESFGKRRATPIVNVPTGVALFPKEIITPVRRWMEPTFTNITHWSEMEKGGHFAAFEQPESFCARRSGVFPDVAIAHTRVMPALAG